MSQGNYELLTPLGIDELRHSSLTRLYYIKNMLYTRKDTLTRLIIEDVYCRLLHSGPSHTFAQIRNMCWIPKGRTEVKKISRKCLICVHHQGGSDKMKPITPWPKGKVTESPAFKHTDLDYFGPLYIKQYKQRKKVWLCIVTCITVREIHHELVENMTSEQFLLALRRFVARPGKLNEII